MAECTVCLAPLRGAYPHAICACSHTFHQSCLALWHKTCRKAGRRPTCPTCRTVCAVRPRIRRQQTNARVPADTLCIDLTDPVQMPVAGEGATMTIVDLSANAAGTTSIRTVRRAQQPGAGSAKARRCSHAKLVRTVRQAGAPVPCFFCKRGIGLVMRRCAGCGVSGHLVCFERCGLPKAKRKAKRKAKGKPKATTT